MLAGCLLQRSDGDQIAIADVTDVCSSEGHDRLGSTGRCDELDLQTIGFVHLHNGAEIAPTQAYTWQVTLQNNGIEECEWHH